MAGSAISAAATASDTATKPAKAKDFKKVCGKKLSATITRATVTPEKNTVLPAVSKVISMALETSCLR